jgi:hypothetical protein
VWGEGDGGRGKWGGDMSNDLKMPGKDTCTRIGEY